jgi:hypothetical protein
MSATLSQELLSGGKLLPWDQVESALQAVIQARDGGIMRYELTDEEWAVIKPMLPNKPRDHRRRLA